MYEKGTEAVASSSQVRRRLPFRGELRLRGLQARVWVPVGMAVGLGLASFISFSFAWNLWGIGFDAAEASLPWPGPGPDDGWLVLLLASIGFGAGFVALLSLAGFGSVRRADRWRRRFTAFVAVLAGGIALFIGAVVGAAVIRWDGFDAANDSASNQALLEAAQHAPIIDGVTVTSPPELRGGDFMAGEASHVILAFEMPGVTGPEEACDLARQQMEAVGDGWIAVEGEYPHATSSQPIFFRQCVPNAGTVDGARLIVGGDGQIVGDANVRVLIVPPQPGSDAFTGQIKIARPLPFVF